MSKWCLDSPKYADLEKSQMQKEFAEIQFMAHSVMSLCNHALSIVLCCHHCHPCLHPCHLHTAVLGTALITETLYPANICICIPSICT